MKSFEASSTRELKIDDGNFHFYLSKNDQAPVMPTTTQTNVPTAAPTTVEKDATSTVKSPLVGTVYLQAKPQRPAYVKVGSRVHKGDVVCIIEAMKMMTEVKSTFDGIVSEILVKDGELVEVDQPLFSITEG